MADATVLTNTTSQSNQPGQSGGRRSLGRAEFLLFSIVIFVGKSYLLVRLPYRSVDTNSLLTAALLLMFYCYFRFRYGITPPVIVILCLAAAVGVDVIGNYLQLYGKPIIGSVQYDEFSHFVGSACSLAPAMWLLRATTNRFGLRLPLDLAAFLSVTITFAFCAYYEILELWDELYFGGQRLWTPRDSANDLQWDLTGIVASALVSVLIFRLAERPKLQETAAA
ncbi:MAG TPA: hypothetical protein VJH03_00125 [Blastocatellia bacterium]|nr:hypothetical protein [Blastocatellia bacterium]